MANTVIGNTMTVDGEIRSWNAAAERLFGYPASEAIGRHVDDLLEARDTLGTDALAGGLEAAVRIRSGERIWVNVSTIVFDNLRTSRRLFVRLARDIGERRHKDELLARMREVARQLVVLTDESADHAPVEALSGQERRVLTLFARGQKPAAIAQELKISAQTLRNHLHHINRKLRTHNRLEAVTHAQRRGLID